MAINSLGQVIAMVNKYNLLILVNLDKEGKINKYFIN
jgi:hypothetical protein